MEKRYTVSTPDQLKALVQISRDDTSKIVNTARVWSSAMRREGKTPWDGRIFVSFQTDGRERRANVLRYGTNDQLIALGSLKYNAALKWCEEHLVKSS